MRKGGDWFALQVQFHSWLAREATEAFLRGIDGKTNTLLLIGNIEGHNSRS